MLQQNSLKRSFYDHNSTKVRNDRSDGTTVTKGIGCRTGAAGMIAFGTIAGGAGAALTGGNFWQGAVTGLVVSGLNHAMHQGEDPKTKSKNSKVKTKTSENKVHADLRSTFDSMEFTGGVLVIGGVVAAPFTEGLSLSVSAVGKLFTVSGHAGNTVLDGIDLYHGRISTGKVVWRQVKFFASQGTSTAISKIAVNSVRNTVKAVQAFGETFVAPILEKQWTLQF